MCVFFREFLWFVPVCILCFYTRLGAHEDASEFRSGLETCSSRDLLPKLGVTSVIDCSWFARFTAVACFLQPLIRMKLLIGVRNLHCLKNGESTDVWDVKKYIYSFAPVLWMAFLKKKKSHMLFYNVVNFSIPNTFRFLHLILKKASVKFSHDSFLNCLFYFPIYTFFFFFAGRSFGAKVYVIRAESQKAPSSLQKCTS